MLSVTKLSDAVLDYFLVEEFTLAHYEQIDPRSKAKITEWIAITTDSLDQELCGGHPSSLKSPGRTVFINSPVWALAAIAVSNTQSDLLGRTDAMRGLVRRELIRSTLWGGGPMMHAKGLRSRRSSIVVFRFGPDWRPNFGTQENSPIEWAMSAYIVRGDEGAWIRAASMFSRVLITKHKFRLTHDEIKAIAKSLIVSPIEANEAWPVAIAAPWDP